MKATLYTDGGSRGNPGPAGVGIVLKLEDKRAIYDGAYIGVATNNQAEYRALLLGLGRAVAEEVDELSVFMDSELIVKQMKGEYRVKDSGLIPLYKKATEVIESLESVTFQHVPRSRNVKADEIVNRVLDSNKR